MLIHLHAHVKLSVSAQVFYNQGLAVDMLAHLAQDEGQGEHIEVKVSDKSDNIHAKQIKMKVM